MRIILFVFILPMIIATSGCKQADNKPRVLISTDIGGGDPDDFQSMVHYLVYADLFETEGLISSPPKNGRKDSIIQVLDRYKIDFENLITYGAYPTYDELMSVTKQGALESGLPGRGKSTEGSDWIIKMANKKDPRPLYILVWGSITDIAQALYDDPGIKKKIRVLSIGSWNTRQDPDSRDYVYENHPDLWFMENDFTFRGMYEGGDQHGDLGNFEFVLEHVKSHGALGDFYFSKKPDIKMGDTPTVLYLLSPLVGGVGCFDDPTAESWGGQFKTTGHGEHYWTDIHDDRPEDAKSVNKWRKEYLRNWQGRMDRCTKPNPGWRP